MADDERHEQPLDEREASERFGAFLDALLGDGRPSPHHVADPDEAEMARLAAELSGAVPDHGSEPDPAFVEQMRRRMREADEGVAAVKTPPPVRADVMEPDPERRGRFRISRRSLLGGAVAAGLGLAAGAMGVSWLRPEVPQREWIWDDGNRLISGPGEWVEVATLDRLPPGTAVAFSTVAFDGYVINVDGEIRALSSVCTHMACRLQFREAQQDLRCPCHGASFDLNGELANSRDRWRQLGGYLDDERAYPIDLPPLIRPELKVEDDRVLIWTART